jgi:indolepyruvate ferredoxin oxidoreductase, beta subunit
VNDRGYPFNDVRPITLLVCALGGEGGGVLAEWLVDSATRAGHLAQSTSIPGVAQRTGATTYYVEVFPVPESLLGGRTPIFGLSPLAGALDAIVSSELLETARQAALGMISKDRTVVISSRDRALTTTEKMAPSDGRIANERLIEVLQQQSRVTHVLDMQATAQVSGTVVSAVMLGAIAGSGLLPMARAAYEAAVAQSGKGVEASLRGFAAGFDAIAAASGQPATTGASRAVARTGTNLEGATQASAMAIAPAAARPAATTASLSDEWPEPVAAFAQLGVERLREYQDSHYADRYRQRLARIVAAERAADPGGAHGFVAAKETARFLALWMAFDDIVHVAHLKGRAARWARVRDEMNATPEEIVYLYDHFKPGIPEFAALLPPALSHKLIAWDRRRQARGKAPMAFPLKVGTHRISGLLTLRILASLRALRPFGSRFREEQVMIDAWLGRIEQGLHADWALGNEIALCGRLIKGYGATNDRGKQNLSHVLDHLVDGPGTPAERAQVIALARTAALADDAGKALDRQLVELGAPPRPPRAQPIVWAKRLGRDAAQSRVASQAKDRERSSSS